MVSTPSPQLYAYTLKVSTLYSRSLVIYIIRVTHCISVGVHQEDVIFLKVVTRSGLIVMLMRRQSLYIYLMLHFSYLDHHAFRCICAIVSNSVLKSRFVGRTITFFFLCGIKCILVIFTSCSFAFEIIGKTDGFSVRC